MGKVKNVNSLKSGRDFVNLAQSRGCEIVQGKGDHVKVRTSNGQSVIVPMHKELRTGTRFSILKAFKALAILTFFLVLVPCLALLSRYLEAAAAGAAAGLP